MMRFGAERGASRAHLRPGSLCSAGLVAFAVAVIVIAAGPSPSSAQEQEQGQDGVLDTSNPGGVLRTITLDGTSLDLGETNPFFQSLGTNARSCASCHVPSAGWTITPDEVQDRFKKTDGLDPIFRTVDGSNSPRADVSTVEARRAAYSMLLKRGVIRIGIPVPADAEFELAAVDDPYGFASAAELSLFRRPLPTTNLRFLTAVMWDGRESFGPMGTTPILSTATPEENEKALFDDLLHQADSATIGHAEGELLTDAQREAIVRFELNLATAQFKGRNAGLLTARGALGGPENLAKELFYVTINDVLGEDVVTGKFEPHAMTLFDAWLKSSNPDQAAVARGAALFGETRIDITDVGGLNDDLNLPVLRGSCTTCHDTPNVGNHSVALPIDIGLTDASRRTPDMPLYTLRNKATGETRQTTDPARALLTGRWKDIGKMKGPVLRGLASRAPYFHDGQAATLGEAVDFYDTRFNMGLTKREKADLVAFLKAL